MSQVIERTQTATHVYFIRKGWRGAFEAEFRPLNPKTGNPWQASRRIVHGADIEPPGWAGRLIAFSTIEKARAAVAWKQQNI
jgi:hypothetical protein